MEYYLGRFGYSLSCRENIERKCWDLRLDMTGFSSREEAEDLASVIRLGYAEEGLFTERTEIEPSNDNGGGSWERLKPPKDTQVIPSRVPSLTIIDAGPPAEPPIATPATA